MFQYVLKNVNPMTIPFKKLVDVEWAGISEQVLFYVIRNTPILQNDIFWNLVEWTDVVDNSPSLQKFITDYKLDVLNSSVIYIDHQEAAFNQKIHVDIDRAKIILFPLLNCNNTRTVFYDVAEEDLEVEWQNNNEELKYFGVKKGHHREIGSFTLDCPVAMDTGVPHAVHVSPEAVFPRLSFAMRFNNSIDHLFS